MHTIRRSFAALTAAALFGVLGVAVTATGASPEPGTAWCKRIPHHAEGPCNWRNHKPGPA